MIEKVDLLASKVAPDAKAGIKFGVRVKLTAKPEHAGDVKAALLVSSEKLLSMLCPGCQLGPS